MTWRRFTFLACAIPAVAAAAEPADDARRVFDAVGAAVVTVKALAEDGTPEMQGSGVVIRDGVVATNCHVVRDAVSLRVATVPRELPAAWIRQHAAQDLCLLSVDGLSLSPVRMRSGSSLAVGEPVFAIGNPLGFGIAVSSGLLAATTTIRGHLTLISTAVQSPGSSGGGLFDQDGRLIGITTAVLGIGQRLTLSLAADGLEELFAHGSPPLPKPAIPTPEPRWNKMAQDLQSTADWTALEKHAQAWHETQPTAAAALVFASQAQLNLERPKEAEFSLRRALELDRDSALAWRQMAIVLDALGREEERDRALDESDRRQPNDAQSWWLRADWNRKRGRLDEAHRQVTDSIRRDPSHAVAWRLLGLIESARGNGDAAAGAFRTALRLGGNEGEMDRAIAGNPPRAISGRQTLPSAETRTLAKSDQAASFYAVGIAEHEHGRLGSAENALRKAVEISPGHADAWNTLGVVLMKSGRLDDAERAYDQAIALAPSKPEYLVNRASLRRVRHRLDLALADARRAIDVSPNNAKALSEYGAVALEARDYSSACRAFGKLADDDLTADILVSFSECLAATGQVEPALNALRRAEAKEPKLIRVHLSMAKVYGAKGDSQAALESENRALALDPTNVIAWSGKGFALLRLGKLEEAVTTLETAVRLAPDSANAQINLGHAQLQSRNIGQAIRTLERAIVLAPDAADARLLLAQAYITVPMPSKAREQAEVLLQKQPTLVPALGFLTLAHLLEHNESAASDSYLRLKRQSPDAARNLRAQAIRGGLHAASSLPE